MKSKLAKLIYVMLFCAVVSLVLYTFKHTLFYRYVLFNSHSENDEIYNSSSIEYPFNALNINTATLEELEQLEAITPKLAQRIVEFREENGCFSYVEDIMKIKGIGQKTFEKIRNSIYVK